MNGLKETVLSRYQQVSKYMIVGAISFSVNFIFLYSLTEFLAIHYLGSAAFGFILATIVNYLLCITFVFESGRHSRFNEILLVFIVSGIGLLLNETIIFLLVEFIKLWYINAGIMAAAVVFFWNYSARKYYVFLK